MFSRADATCHTPTKVLREVRTSRPPNGQPAVARAGSGVAPVSRRGHGTRRPNTRAEPSPIISQSPAGEPGLTDVNLLDLADDLGQPNSINVLCAANGGLTQPARTASQ